MSREIAAAPGQKTLMRDLLEKGPSSMSSGETCFKQASDGCITSRVRWIGDMVVGEFHATVPAMQ